MTKTYYAVFDTNVLVSALLTKRVDSPTIQLLDCVFDGRIVLLYNDAIIREYEDVLHRKHFAFPEERVAQLIALVKTGLHLEPTECDEIFLDEDDKVFYEVALSKNEGYVVTGNVKHFPKSPIVVTPAEMMRIIEGA